jgi:hypothetical protein
MDIRELDKKQLVLLTLLITFVVSIATGIVTVSLMNQMPKSVPQTINNVIQRTIEKVTTIPAPAVTTVDKTDNSKDNSLSLFDNNSEALVSIYLNSTKVTTDTSLNLNTTPVVTTNNTNVSSSPSSEPVAIGQGIIISDIGLILVDSSILTEDTLYKVILNKTDFNASILKKFDNGFTILKISAITDKPVENTTKNTNTGNPSQ